MGHFLISNTGPLGLNSAPERQRAEAIETKETPPPPQHPQKNTTGETRRTKSRRDRPLLM